jgi:hypothetical protein
MRAYAKVCAKRDDIEEAINGMTLWKLFLRAYPRSWRDEYGEEFAAVLAQQRLTLGVVADVLGNGARQHLLRDEAWKICGAVLALWNLTVLVLAAERFVITTRPTFLWCYSAGFLLLFAAGGWTVLREKSGIRRATVASAKAALVGHALDVVGLFAMLRNGGARWIPRSLEVNVVLCLLFALAGVLPARFFTSLRKEPREA